MKSQQNPQPFKYGVTDSNTQHPTYVVQICSFFFSSPPLKKKMVGKEDSTQSLELTQEIQERLVELLRLVKVTGVARSRQHDNSGFRYLLKVRQRLKAQGSIMLPINNQSWSLERSKH